MRAPLLCSVQRTNDTGMNFSITKLHPLFAVRVEGVDIARGISDADFTELRIAFEEHSVIVISNQDLDDSAQTEFSQRFGPLEMMLPHAGNNLNPGHISRMYNSEVDGTIIPPDDHRMIYLTANRIWHTDSSFKEIPSLCSLLYAHEVPPTGGETEFASMRAAYCALDTETKSLINDKVALHHAARTRDLVATGLVTPDRRATSPVRHAMVRSNPVNGRKALYTGGHAGKIEGMEESESDALLVRLLDHTTQPAFVYAHKWSIGDIVIWDNRAVLHRGRPWNDAAHKRTLHRTTVAGDGPTI